MRSFLLSKIVVPLHLAIIVAYLAWAQPGPDSIASYLPLSFLCLGLLEVMLLFPSARRGEDVDFARERVCTEIKEDPVLHIGLLGMAFALLQVLNGPRQLVYVRARHAWEYTSGHIEGFPACLDMLLSAQGLFLVVTVLLALLAVRRSMGRNGRTLLVEFIVAVATVLGLYGLYLYARTPFYDELGGKILEAPETFATFSSKTEAGAFFLMNSCAAFGFLFKELVRESGEDEEDRGKFRARVLFFAFVVNVGATLFTLSCLSIALLFAVLILLAVYTFVFVIKNSPGELSLSSFAAVVILIAAVGFLHFVAYPENRIHDCTARIFSGEWRTGEEKAEQAVLKSAAWRMAGDNIVGGVGKSCYGIESGFPKYVLEEEWESVKDPDARHYLCGNDFAQLLAEQGAVGAVLFLSPFVMMLIGAVARISKLIKYGTKTKHGIRSTTATDDSRIGIFDIVEPHVLALFAAAGIATAMSFFVPVFGSLLNVLVWAIFFAAAVTSLPKPVRR